jgi:Helicase conserved C-terminal domain
VTAALETPAPAFASHLYPWQIEGGVRACTDLSLGAIWAAGSGKGLLAPLSAQELNYAGEIALTVVCAEAGKVLDYVADFERFAGMLAIPFENSAACWRKVDKLRPPVLVTTYETARNTLCTFKKSGMPDAAGPLMEYLDTRRIQLILDETTKLANRSSRTYKAFWWALKRLRARSMPGGLRVLATTATTVTRNPDSHFNIFRLLDPAAAGTVADYEKAYVAGWSKFRENEPTAYKNLTAADCDPGVTPLAEKFAHLIHRVSKDDPEVARHFPIRDERPPTVVTLGTDQADLLDAIADHFADSEAHQSGALFGVLRQAAGHPLSLLASEDGQAANEVVRVVGEAGLARVGSAKTEKLIEIATAMTGQMVVFTFYGQSVLPLLREELVRAGISVSVNVGVMSAPARQRSKAEFLAGDTQIYLSSDAGARGISLGCAGRVLNYEPPAKYETYLQRSDRIHRVDSPHPVSRIDSLLAKDTTDAGAYDLMLRRNAWQDALTGSESEEGLTVADRRAMLDPSYRTKRRKR